MIDIMGMIDVDVNINTQEELRVKPGEHAGGCRMSVMMEESPDQLDKELSQAAKCGDSEEVERLMVAMAKSGRMAELERVPPERKSKAADASESCIYNSTLRIIKNKSSNLAK